MFEVTGETASALFREIASIQEVFDAEKTCGCCNGTDLRFIVRTVDENDYYEISCGNQDCRARFAFGQNKKGGGLFPKRKDKENKWLPNRGWGKYVPKATDAENSGDGQYHEDDAPPPPPSRGFGGGRR
jgi:hypothetical protein